MLQSAMLNHPLPAQTTIDLSGIWEFRLDGDAEWRPIAVPGCWEQLGVPKDLAGPAWFRTTLPIPAGWAERRIWLHFGAVSYGCQIYVNGSVVGEHTGLWDAFAVEITGTAVPGATAELLLRVEKPAGLTAGPDSARLPGRFPLRETLAGFLPYVWGHMFGGIWQAVTLLATGPAVFQDLQIRADAAGHVRISATLSAPAAVVLQLRDPAGQIVFAANEPASRGENDLSSPMSASSVARYYVNLECHIRDPQPWSPHAPQLYTARLAVEAGDERAVRFGLRSLRAEGAAIVLNGQPIYPRMALSWGWYPQALHNNPGPERVRADFARLKQLGYNGVKLCLWFPPQYYFELADELGMLLWVELPMWIPQPSAFFRAQTPIEYDRLMRLARQHPSVIFYTLGCELGRAVDAGLLAPLYALVKRHAGDALVRDNSGSGEAYGGLLDEFAEFYDYHFYSDLQHLRGLLDYFSPRGRPPQPWVFGEFCDYDTFRDPRLLRRVSEKPPSLGRLRPSLRPGLRPGTPRVQNAVFRILSRPKAVSKGARPTIIRLGTKEQEPRTGGYRLDQEGDPTDALAIRGRQHSSANEPWWMSDDPKVNPQGARWLYELAAHEPRLRASGMWERGAELQRVSEAQGLLHRKYTLELVRLYHEIAGYVVTGEADTPISSAGMWDQGDRLKFDPAAFCGFNGDFVLLAGWDRRREWLAGGDRAAPWDTWSYLAGASVRAHLIASHYGQARGPAHVAWRVAFPGAAPFAEGMAQTPFALDPGELRELAIAEFAAPALAAPRQALLATEATIGGERAQNSWPIWVFPRRVWAGRLALYDPPGRLRDLLAVAPAVADLACFGDLEKARPAQRPAVLDQSDLVVAPTADLAPPRYRVVIATLWTHELRAYVENGGRAILLQAGAGPPGPLPVAALPFWREAIRLAEPHPAWRDFPLDDALGMQLFGCASDHAFDLAACERPWAPILRRLDARTMQLHEYAAELRWGAGRLIVSTLRFEGGQGAQPLGIARNTAAAYLLWCWAEYLMTARFGTFDSNQ